MFGIGIPELVIILIVALLVVGPAKLPELARSMGKALGEFRRLADDVKETIEQEMAQEPEKEEETQKRAFQEEEQKTEEAAGPIGPILGDGHLVAEEEQKQGEQKAEETPMSQGKLFAEEGRAQEQTEEQKEEQRAEAEPAPDGRQVAEEEKNEEFAQKVAEGIRVNDSQKI